MTADHLAANRSNWDDRVAVHMASDFYDIEGWLERRPGPRPWEAESLGDVSGLDVVHLQCHIGLDTLALANAGARAVGLDFSSAAIEQARALAARAHLEDSVRFVEADVLHATDALPPAQFDVVYVSMGALCWLPSVAQWASQVPRLLRPGGRLHLHDNHPLAWALGDDVPVVEQSYFEEATPHVDDSGGTYTGDEVRLGHRTTYEWNHSLGEIISALLDAGMRLDALVEHDWTVWPRFSWLVPTDDGRWTVPADRPRLPLSFTIRATRHEMGELPWV